MRDFARDTRVRLHGGTDEDTAPTGIIIGDKDRSGNFCKVLLRELRTERGKDWLHRWTSLAEQGGFAKFQSGAQVQLLFGDCRFLRYREYRFTFVVGSLGTWDPENDNLLPVLGIGRTSTEFCSKSFAIVTPLQVLTGCWLSSADYTLSKAPPAKSLPDHTPTYNSCE